MASRACLTAAVSRVEALLLLLELVVEQRERLLVGADLAQLHVDLDLPPVELPVHLRALGLDLLLGLAFHLLRRRPRASRRATSSSSAAFSLRHAAGVARDEPDNQKTQASAGNAGDDEQRTSNGSLSENQQDEVGCAS